MRILYYFILFFLIVGNVISQNCKIENPLLIEKININESFIEKKIIELKKFYISEDVKALEKQIIGCNNNIDISIPKLKTTLTNFSLDKQELLKVKDLKELKKQIEAKEKSKEEIKVRIQSDLSTINLKGLFLCALKDLDPMSFSNAMLSDQSISLVAPSAIEFINCTFI